MGIVPYLFKIFSLIVFSSPFIVKLYEFKPKLFQNIVLNFFIIFPFSATEKTIELKFYRLPKRV